MEMRIDEGRRQQLSACINGLGDVGTDSRRHVDDATIGHQHVDAGAPVGQRGVAQQQVGHYLVPKIRSPASPNPGRM